jgi:hypothetical protein
MKCFNFSIVYAPNTVILKKIIARRQNIKWKLKSRKKCFLTIYLYDLFYNSFSKIFLRIQKNVYPIHTTAVLCSTLVNLYLLVVLYGKLSLKKASHLWSKER